MSKAVKTVAAVAVGAVVGFLMGGPAGAMYGAAMGLAVGAFATEMPVAKGTIRQNEPSSQTLRSSKAAARFILGKVSTGGVLNWAQEQPGEQTEGEWLHLVYVLSEGTIDGVEDVFLNEEPIGNYGADASYEVVSNPTQPNAFLLANCPGWKDTQIGKGLSYIRVSLKYSAEKFPSGIPDTRFVVRGRNDIYDPRTGAFIYTENAALLILWYLRNRCGVPDNEIIMPSFASAANTCSEGVSNPDGGNSPARYRLGAVIGADERKTDVLQKMLDACSGRLIRVGGRWMLQVGAYYGPYDFTITEDMVIGAVTGTVEVDNESAINTISGTFVDPQQAWAETDYPSVSVQEWIAQDGVELSESLDLAYVYDPYQAQRLANIKLRQRRSGGALSIPLNFFGYNCRPGRVVRVNLPSLNIQGEFVVTDWSMSATDACTVTVEAYDAEQFDDAVGVPYNPIGFIQMPAGGLAAPTGLVWTPDAGPEVRQGILSWALPYGEIAYSGVVIRNEAGESVQTYQVPGASSNCQVQGLPAGRYAMSVFCRSDKGKSAEAAIGVSVLGPPQPQAVSVQAGFDSITLIPFNTNSLNGGTYEYRYALTPVAQPETATLLGRGDSFTHNGLAFNTTYHYYVRSVNAYGSSQYFYVSATTDSSAENILKLLDGQIQQSQLGQYLKEQIGAIPDLSAQIDAINTQLAEITGAAEWEPDQPYLAGTLVKEEGAIYRAIRDVPAGTAVSDSSFWEKIGDYESIGELVSALAVQVNSLRTTVDDATGAIAAQADRLDAIALQLGQKAEASVVQNLSARVEQTEQGIRTAIDRTDRMYVQINPNGAGDADWGAGDLLVTAGTITVQSIAADDNSATNRRMDVMTARVGDAEASISNLRETTATEIEAVAKEVETLVAELGEDLAVKVEQTSQAVASLDKGLSAMWSVKLQANQNGQYVATGIGSSIENNGGNLQSSFYVLADRFAVLNTFNGTPTTVFAVQGGQTILNSAIIGNATISFAKIGDDLQSTNYVPGQTGWRLAKNGTFEINAPLPGGGRTQIDNTGVAVFDPNGVRRVKIGQLR